MVVLPRLFALLLLGRGSADDLHDLSHPSWDRLEATWDRLAVDAGVLGVRGRGDRLSRAQRGEGGGRGHSQSGAARRGR